MHLSQVTILSQRTISQSTYNLTIIYLFSFIKQIMHCLGGLVALLATGIITTGNTYFAECRQRPRNTCPVMILESQLQCLQQNASIIISLLQQNGLWGFTILVRSCDVYYQYIDVLASREYIICLNNRIKFWPLQNVHNL